MMMAMVYNEWEEWYPRGTQNVQDSESLAGWKS